MEKVINAVAWDNLNPPLGLYPLALVTGLTLGKIYTEFHIRCGSCDTTFYKIMFNDRHYAECPACKCMNKRKD